MPEGEIYDAIDRFRRDLLRLERRSASEIVRVYGEAWKRIKSELERLQTEYEFARSRGEKPGPDWVYQFNRARSFRDQVLQELQSFAQYAEGKVRNDQEEAIRIAEEQSERLTRLALGTPPTGLEINWNRIDRAAVQSILGMTQPDSPLHRLLMSISTDGAQAAEDALVQGMLLGQNPREVARTMRKVLGTALSRALTIARTETLRAHREATRASYQANSDIVKGWIWHSAADERTCFPAGTLVTTRRGDIPIELVRVGDEVLTHKMRYRKVTEVLKRNYDGYLVTVATSENRVIATSNHPFLVQRKGKLNWVEAANLVFGDVVFCKLQSGSQVSNHGFIDVTIKRSGYQSHDKQSTILQKSILFGVSKNNPVMPIWLVNLKGNIQRWKQEINSIFSNLVFLRKINIKADQAQSDISFGFGFPGITPVTTEGAKSPSFGFGWNNAELLTTGKTGSSNRWTAAIFGAIRAVLSWMNIKNFSASFACGINHIGMCTVCRTIKIPIGATSRYCKLLSTARANFCNNAIVFITFFRAIGLILTSWMKQFSTFWTNTISTWFCGITTRFSAVRMKSLIGRIAFAGAKFTVSLSHPRVRNAKGFGTHQANTIHASIIKDIQYHTQSLTVFNLEVDEDHSYIANGFVVHNCAACWAMHGTEHRLDEILDDHPNGRCTAIPLSRTWAEIGARYGVDLSDIPDTNPEIEPGTALFEKLSQEQQIKILGPAKWQAWKDGKFALADIVGRARSKEWGTHRYERSLKEILNSPRETPKPKPEEFINYTKAKIDAVRKYAAHWADFRKTLTESELFQLREYKRFGFKRMNSALRSGYIFDDTKEIINALKKAPGLPEHTRLFRGVARDALPKNIEIGDVIVDKGFVSTSLSSSLAREFGGTIIEILAPKGTPGIFMDYFGSSEWEVLLPNKSMFRVVSVESRRIVVEWIGVEK